jgi:hypothetical protein
VLLDLLAKVILEQQVMLVYKVQLGRLDMVILELLELLVLLV